MSNWQPIETAPTEPHHDAPVVLLWVDGGGEFRKGCHAFGRCYRLSDGMVRARPFGFHGFECTHWMPLPEPPQTGEPK